MIECRSVAQVRAAEEAAFRVLPEGTLMQRAAYALGVSCARLLADLRGRVGGARVLLLIGAGSNGGDALWAGAHLASRGCRVDAVLLADRHHQEGAQALVAAGGRLHRASAAGVHGLVETADLVLDGITGIGGTGGLRPDAAELVEVAESSGAVIVAVDVPSGVDADSGEVSGAAVHADITVTFGAIKPGLLVAPGLHHCGAVHFIDIGLDFGDEEPVARAVGALDVDAWVPEPTDDDYKYSRGVVGLAVGSASYPGAGALAVAGARHANAGMVRVLDRRDGVAAVVVERFPDVVVDSTQPAAQARATAWACGSGFIGSSDDEQTVLAVLDADAPVVLDAGALTVVAESADVRSRIEERHRAGLATVLTPHVGEFERLCPELLGRGRLEAARQGAAQLSCVMVLKGAGTVMADPAGAVFVDLEGTSALGVAGSGDVLTGILGSVLAHAHAEDAEADLLEAVAAAVWLHGRAGQLALAPATALDIADQVGAAVRAARFGDHT